MADNLSELLQPEIEIDLLDTLEKPPQHQEHEEGYHHHCPNEANRTTWADMETQIGPVSFDWHPWLPSGFLTELVSDPGIGKSGLCLRISGSYTNYLPYPDGTYHRGSGGMVLWCEAEAAQAININRAKKWGLSLDRIITPFEDGLIDVNLLHKSHIAAVTEKASLPGVGLIVVDSLSGSSMLKENDSEIKRITEFLARLARNTGKPILLTHHLRKRGQFEGTTITLDQVRGSSAIVQAARVVWALDKPNRESPKARLSMIKNNLARFADPIGLEITENGVTFSDAPLDPQDKSLTEKAADLLRALLANGPRPQVEIERDFTNAGISKATMNRVKAKMHIISRKDGTRWLWGFSAREINQ